MICQHAANRKYKGGMTYRLAIVEIIRIHSEFLEHVIRDGAIDIATM